MHIFAVRHLPSRPCSNFQGTRGEHLTVHGPPSSAISVFAQHAVHNPDFRNPDKSLLSIIGDSKAVTYTAFCRSLSICTLAPRTS